MNGHDNILTNGNDQSELWDNWLYFNATSLIKYALKVKLNKVKVN